MRSDYALYVVAVIFFLITALSFAVTQLADFERNVWIVTTVVLGLLFAGLGYTQRPKVQPAQTQTEMQPKATTPTLQPQPVVVEPIKKEITEPVAEVTTTPKLDLTAVKGIKAKRAEQLKGIGISSIEDLARASADDLGNKLKISPKITGKWIEQAKLLLEKS